jgi:Rrf2 family protein
MFKISEAASLALHTAGMLAAHSDRLVSTREAATLFKISEAHLSKVLQRLVKAGLVKSLRGPRGGFSLHKPSNVITLLQVYEAIEGPMVLDRCILGHDICPIDRCLMGDLVGSVNRQTWEYLNKTTLDKLTNSFKR